MYTKFNDFCDNLNEAKIIAKRKYTDKYPEHVVSTVAPTRNKVLEFLNSKGKVSHSEFNEFLKQLSEERGRRTSWGWVKKNEHLIDTHKSKTGETMYSLTRRGKRIYELSKPVVESFDNRTEQYVLYLESSIDEDRKEEYQEFFKKKLKDYGVDSPADLSEEEKKKFFNEISDEWK